MVLSYEDIRKRLITVKEAGLLKNFLEMVQMREIPKELDRVLDEGRIVMDPVPPDEWFDGDTIDISFGNVLEVPETPLEIVKINGETVIRRVTIDFRIDSNNKRLDHLRKISIEDQSRIRFILDDNETLELQPGMLVLAHTRELICVPYDLQMQIGGRSRIARCGVSAHISSPVFHPGWCGHPTMEVKNDGQHSVNVYPGLPFAFVMFLKLSSKTGRPYLKKAGAKFSGQH